MNNNNQPTNIDPVELINEHYEAVEIRDDFRRDLQIKTRGIVSTRRRKPLLRWTLGFVGAAAAIALLIPAGQLMHSGVRNGQQAPHHQQTVFGNKPPAPAAPHNENKVKKPEAIAITPKNHVGKPEHLPVTATTARAANTKAINLTPPAASRIPIVVLTAALQPVKDDAGHALSIGDRVSVGTTIVTGAKGRATFVTRNGSQLYMDSNTRLVFSSDKVATISCGRLYCSNRNKEIAQIETPAGSVKLLGTVVDTNIVRKDTVAVTVVEGKVQLSNQHGSALVDAGNQSVMAAFRSPQKGMRVNTYAETAWYSGKGAYQSDFGDIAYTVPRDHITEVWVMKPDGSNKRRLMSYIGKADLGNWTPGSQQFELSSTSIGLGALPQDWLLNAVTGQTLPFKPLPLGYWAMYRNTSPDQMRVAFTGVYNPEPGNNEKAQSGLFVQDRVTGEVKTLIVGDIKTEPAWAPDSRHIAISTGQGYTLNHNLVIIDADTGNIQDLKINGAGACFSPDGTKMLYTSDFDEHSGYSRGIPGGCMFVLDLISGAEPRMVLPKNERVTGPRWSPDSTQVLYNRDWYSYCVANINAGEPKLLYSCGDNDYCDSAEWAPSGDAVYVTIKSPSYQTKRTLLIAADGSSTKEIVNDTTRKQSKLPAIVEAQAKATCDAIQKAASEYEMADKLKLQGKVSESRMHFRSAADLFTRLVWDYPLAGICAEDALRYADAVTLSADASDADMLEEVCGRRMECLLNEVIAIARYDKCFPVGTSALTERLLAKDNKLDLVENLVRLSKQQPLESLLLCPGLPGQKPAPFTYSAPEPGVVPKEGDVVLSCPLHPNVKGTWKKEMSNLFDADIMEDGEPNSPVCIHNTPFAIEKVGAEPMSCIYHLLTGKYEVRGTAKLLPTGQIFSNTEFTLPSDKGSMARFIDSFGALDWGHMEDRSMAKTEFAFCRAVAQYEAGLPVTEWYKTIDGEPADLLFNGNASGSCGEPDSNLRFELIGPGHIELYQLKPSGRFRVYGTVRIWQTGKVCKNGWVDKDGNVISTEK